MNHSKSALFVIVLALGSNVYGQALDSKALVQKAISASSQVRAAQAALASKEAQLKASRFSTPAIIELAPGVGYTNGNFALSQELDFFGRRSSRESLASGEAALAEVELLRVQANVAEGALELASRLLMAKEIHETSLSAVQAARELLETATKLNSIGEVPKSHVTRAELEVLRSQQMAAVSAAELKAVSGLLNITLGEPMESQPLIAEWTSPQEALANRDALSFDVLAARAELALSQSRVRSVKNESKPTVTAGVTSDAWSLDKGQWRSDDFGLQAMIRIPLSGRSQTRQSVLAAEEGTKQSEALVQEAIRRAQGAKSEASILLQASQSVSQSYSTEIIPKAMALVDDLRKGYQAGLVTLLEVVEAQETLLNLRREKAESDRAVRTAEINLMKAVLALPGLEVSK